MSQIIVINDEQYVNAASSLADDRTRVLKHGNTFAVFNRSGDFQPLGRGEQGLYHEGTRYLSRLVLTIDDQHPLLLHSTIEEDNDLLTVDLMNPDLDHEGEDPVPHATLHIFRAMTLWEGMCAERIPVANHGRQRACVTLSLMVDADFLDIFEIRGYRREERGILHDPQIDDGGITFGYTGLDGATLYTRVDSDPAPDGIIDRTLLYHLALDPGERIRICVTYGCFRDMPRENIERFPEIMVRNRDKLRSFHARTTHIVSSNSSFNSWLNRSFADLYMLLTATPEGFYPYAGVPWFSTPFGRDGILTAWECLMIDPDIAAGVLRYLAARQATDVNPRTDAEPGKIMHETRKGELAELGIVPFKLYYGSIDATPLFVGLAGAYLRYTDDRELIEELWPNIEAAVRWIEEYGDLDGDGFIEFRSHSPNGLVYHGWKDSNDSVFDEDGRLARGPIALCEVQGYVYDAFMAAAYMAERIGRGKRAPGWRARAEELRQRFDDVFWSDRIGCYITALDGDKKPCIVRTSNAGHALFSGIALPRRAHMLARQLMGPSMFSGWGIRTLGTGEANYNPMSYHNGSVWPHDNALIAWGVARYGLHEEAQTLMTAMFDTACATEMQRLPELLCGFPRREGSAPTNYPTACRPQAWATGAVFLLLQSCLSLSIDAAEGLIRLTNPHLPEFLDKLQFFNLRVGRKSADITLYRYPHGVGLEVNRKSDGVEVQLIR